MSVVRSKVGVPFGVAAAEDEANEATEMSYEKSLQNHQII